MTRRFARFLTRLYPARWRARYGAEFQTFLESRRVRPIEVLTTIAAALSERLSGSLATLLYTCAAAIGVGGAFYMSMSGVPLAHIVEAHRALCLLWAVIEACSLVTVALGFAAVAPAAFTLLRKPGAFTRKGVRLRLAWLAATGLLLLVMGLLPLLGVTGGGTTLTLLGGFVEATGNFLNYIVGRSKLSRSLGRVKRAVPALARSIVFMTLMAAGNGFDRHSGVLGAYAFWSLVPALIAVGAISGLLSARRLDSLE